MLPKDKMQIAWVLIEDSSGTSKFRIMFDHINCYFKYSENKTLEESSHEMVRKSKKFITLLPAILIPEWALTKLGGKGKYRLSYIKMHCDYYSIIYHFDYCVCRIPFFSKFYVKYTRARGLISLDIIV